ncbi:neural proliferation differentiation and control protein 1 isoform X1 [Equus quagga]|uniref:neural proliferation differentiation and control protein 1 isoform X1 n=1 Tax=Equus quagga TaxID=89248 RepID=UPI001EE33B82|nr:neural proliferation differentiation and control protein 1 isoform X1 [Equus quagga]
MATPVPPPSPRHLRLLRLLLSGLVLGAALRGAAAGRPDVAACPGSLDCALKRRARCPPGAHICGPCLQPFQEDHQGLCVPRMRRPPAEGPPQPRLEDEIDFLARELARQEAGPSRLTAPPQLGARQRLLEPAATLGLSERGQGPDLGLPSTRGAPAPTPHTSLGTPVSSGPVHMAPLEPRGERGDGLALVLVVVCSVAGAAAFAVAALCWCSSPGTSGWPTAPRCTTTSTRGSRCGAWSGIKSRPRSWTRLPRTRRTKTATSRCTSARAWPRPERWRCGTRCSTTPRCRRPRRRCPSPRSSDLKAHTHPLRPLGPPVGRGRARRFPLKRARSDTRVLVAEPRPLLGRPPALPGPLSPLRLS